MIVVKCFGVALAGGAVMHDDILPAAAFHLGFVDRCTHRGREVTVFGTSATKKPSGSGLRRRNEPLVFCLPGFFNYDGSIGSLWSGRRLGLRGGTRSGGSARARRRRGLRCWTRRRGRSGLGCCRGFRSSLRRRRWCRGRSRISRLVVLDFSWFRCGRSARRYGRCTLRRSGTRSRSRTCLRDRADVFSRPQEKRPLFCISHLRAGHERADDRR